MKGYFALFKARMLTLFQYRGAALAGFCTQIFWGFVKIMILSALFLQSDSVQPISLPQAISIIWIGQGLLQLLPWFVDKEIEEQVRTGNVAYDLVRPLNLYWYWFARSMALRITPTIMRFIPVMILALFFGLQMPASWASMLLFIFSIFLAATLSAAMTTMVMISLFWTLSGEGILRLLPHLTMVLSGLLIPLPLMPTWLQPFLSLQPFRCLIDIPSRLYLGIIPASDAFYALGLQIAWTLFFIIFGYLLISKATKRLVIQGG